jgi:hypothetical protein
MVVVLLLVVAPRRITFLFPRPPPIWPRSSGFAPYVSPAILTQVRPGFTGGSPADAEGKRTSVRIVENVMQAFSTRPFYNTGAGRFGISDSGSLMYAARGIVPDLKNLLVWVDQRGIEQPVTDLQHPFLAPRLSPDGQRIAY